MTTKPSAPFPAVSLQKLREMASKQRPDNVHVRWDETNFQGRIQLRFGVRTYNWNFDDLSLAAHTLRLWRNLDGVPVFYNDAIKWGRVSKDNVYLLELARH